MKKTLILAFAVTILTTFNAKILQAQTKDEAIVAFNAALELSKTDMAGAVVKMQDVVKMCTTVGKEADTLKMKANSVLPVWQYNVGNNLKNDKKYDLAIAAYEKSNEFAVANADANIKEKSANQLVLLYTSKGSTLLKADKADSALLCLDKALTYNPDYSKALFAKGQVYKKKGDNAKMVENMELAITSATKTNDTVIIKAAKNMIGSSLNQEGIAAYNKKAYSEAVTKLNAALGYGFKTKDLYYVLASSNNSLKKYDEAIEAAKSGLTMEESQTNDKLARYYCEIAKAYEGKKDIGNACANYKKAAYGAFAQFSNDKIKNVLKCQ
jgi:tetratricopeptide (TPR) repeat protein